MKRGAHKTQTQPRPKIKSGNFFFARRITQKVAIHKISVYQLCIMISIHIFDVHNNSQQQQQQQHWAKANNNRENMMQRDGGIQRLSSMCSRASLFVGNFPAAAAVHCICLFADSTLCVSFLLYAHSARVCWAHGPLNTCIIHIGRRPLLLLIFWILYFLSVAFINHNKTFICRANHLYACTQVRRCDGPRT